MLIRKSQEIRSSEITPRDVFFDRRRFLTKASVVGAGAVAAATFPGLSHLAFADKLATVPSKYSIPDAQTPYGKATSYNNFYEFGTEKTDPAKNAHTLHTRPWTITVDGLVANKQTFDIETIMTYRPIESRVYRHRCVEAWSMVIPWDGYSLSEFIKACDPLPSAKYVQFLSLADKKQMPGLSGGYDWPYSEGLRMDEAMHPLALLCFGCYGETLPNQNGAPIRVVLPWKYGFKSAKSIVHIRFTDKQPKTLWNEISAEEYGFYSNVNPAVNHRRWSQKTERRIDSSFLPKSIPTQPFNGYGSEVASLYDGMDLKKYY